MYFTDIDSIKTELVLLGASVFTWPNATLNEAGAQLWKKKKSCAFCP